MSFAITFTGEPDEFLYDDSTIPSAIGRLQLGNYHETFVSTLAEWDKQAYRDQWFNALRQFVEGADRAVLITNYLSPAPGTRIEWWALYRGDGDCVHVQNRLPTYDMLHANFSAANASSFLEDRRTLTEDGLPLSEWTISVREVERFYYFSFNRLADGTRKGDFSVHTDTAGISVAAARLKQC